MRVVSLVWLVACASGGDACPEGTVGRDGVCEPYDAGEPADDAPKVAFPNGLTWQWQLTGAIDTQHDVEVYDVDLFELDGDTRAVFEQDRRRILCYLSAGSYEPWRPDADAFPAEVIGKPLDGWPDERWLDVRAPVVLEIMEARLDMAAAIGCVGVELDNITAYRNASGFPLNVTEQLAYDRALADAAHARGLAVAMKNDVDHVEALEPWFDLAVNEECAAFDECDTLAPFVDADKAVLHAEYVDDLADAPAKAAEVCGVEPGLSTIVKDWDLGPSLQACP